MHNQQCPLQNDEFRGFGEVFIDLGILENFHDICRFTNGSNGSESWI